MIECVRRITFCAAHRLYKHESKCAFLHGHNYVAFIHAQAEGELDLVGRVIDFGTLKQKFGGWIDASWDHGVILFAEDGEAINLIKRVPSWKLYILPYNPTAENMARYLLEEVAPILMRGEAVAITKVVVWETENGYAEAVYDQ